VKANSKRAKKQNKASFIREIARNILRRKGAMIISELSKVIQEMTGMNIRSDHLISSMTVKDSEFIVHTQNGGAAMVTLKDQITEREEVTSMAGKHKSKKKANSKGVSKTAKKMTPAEFTLLAIEKLADPGYNSIHSVYSSFNSVFREYFPGLNPVEEVQKMTKAGIISIRPVKGGVLIFAGNKKQIPSTEKVLAKMGLK